MLIVTRGYLGRKLRREYHQTMSDFNLGGLWRKYAPQGRRGWAYQPTTVDRQHRYTYIKLLRARAIVPGFNPQNPEHRLLVALFGVG